MDKNNDLFGKEKEITEICDKLSNSNYEGGNISLSNSSTITEKIKYELCQGISLYKREKELDLVTLANLLNLNENLTDKLLRGHIENFSLDRLISYGERLHLSFQMNVNQ